MNAFEPRDANFRANPYPAYDILRENNPIFYRHNNNDWVLTRYTDIVFVLKNENAAPPLASKSNRINSTAKNNGSIIETIRHHGHRIRSGSVLATPPPSHHQIRKLLAPVFSEDATNIQKKGIEEYAYKLLSAKKTDIDIVNDYSLPLVYKSISNWIGIPATDHERLAPLVRAMATTIDAKNPSIYDRSNFATVALFEYFKNLITTQRDKINTNTVIGILIESITKGELTKETAIDNIIFLFFTGTQGGGLSILSAIQSILYCDIRVK